jgi:hypothetical protein
MNSRLGLFELFLPVEQYQRVDVSVADVTEMTSLEPARVEVGFDFGDESREF